MRSVLLGATLLLLASGCGWVLVNANAIQGEYVLAASSGEPGPAVEASKIVLRDGTGTLTTPVGTHELTYTLSDQSSPWITLILDDGRVMHLQYRRPGQLTFYDPLSGALDYRRVGR